MTVANPCVVCHKNRAEQQHHLSYEPELIIEVCVDCHEQLHKHGVGRGIRIMGDDDMPKEIDRHFTKSIKKDGKNFIVDADTDEVLNWIVCSCGATSYHLYANAENRFFMRCIHCGQDFGVNIDWWYCP